eukprot:Sro889_g216590.2  (183) ;mRNA; r:23794-24342
MDTFFGIIQDAIINNAQRISVGYSQQGYPTNIYIQKSNGEVYDVTISGFQSQRLRKRNLQNQRWQQEHQQLNASRNKWKSQNIQNYEYKYQKFGPNHQNIVYPWTVIVRGFNANANDGNNNPIYWASPPTMDTFFGIIQDAIINNAQRITVSYSQQGYPTNIYIQKSNGEVYDVGVSAFVSQ